MCITFFCLYPYQFPKQAQKGKVEGSKQFYSSNQLVEVQQKLNSSDAFKHKKIKEQQKDEQKCQNRKDNVDCNGQNYSKIQQQNLEKHKQRIKFIIAFNRDQQSHRKTLKMGPFAQDPNIYAGRDIKSTGTWLGVNIKTGLMVILTNYDMPVFRPGKSRGQLVKSFLSTAFVYQQQIIKSEAVNDKIRNRLIQILKQSKQYSAFNLLVYNIRNDSIFYICSELEMKEPVLLQKHKMYGLCNSDLFNIWPKTKHGLELFISTLSQIRDEDDQNILKGLVDKVMKDKKGFSENPNDQASVFIQPFYSTLQQAQRMTKSTFLAIVKQVPSQNKEYNGMNSQNWLIMRQITHENPNKKQSIQGEQYDHLKQVTVDFKFRI